MTTNIFKQLGNLDEEYLEVDLLKIANVDEASKLTEQKIFNLDTIQGVTQTLVIGARMDYAWLYVAHTARNFVGVFNLPGCSPVGGCSSEWDPRSRKPFWGSAKFYLLSVQRADGKVLVRGGHSYGNPLHSAVGYISI